MTVGNKPLLHDRARVVEMMGGGWGGGYARRRRRCWDWEWWSGLGIARVRQQNGTRLDEQSWLGLSEMAIEARPKERG